MNIKVDYIGGGGTHNGPEKVRKVTITIDGETKFTLTHDHIYGLVINKIDLTDTSDSMQVIPRSSNEIQIK